MCFTCDWAGSVVAIISSTELNQNIVLPDLLPACPVSPRQGRAEVDNCDGMRVFDLSVLLLSCVGFQLCDWI